MLLCRSGDFMHYATETECFHLARQVTVYRILSFTKINIYDRNRVAHSYRIQYCIHMYYVAAVDSSRIFNTLQGVYPVNPVDSVV